LISNARHDRFRGSFQARTLSLEGRPRAGAFARTGKIERVRTAARVKAPCGKRFTEIGAPRGRRPIQEFGFEKARGRFSGAGLILDFRDDEDMPVICPTGQVFF
jgi:hypothetical protein